jgi:hypothetical protein
MALMTPTMLKLWLYPLTAAGMLSGFVVVVGVFLALSGDGEWGDLNAWLLATVLFLVCANLVDRFGRRQFGRTDWWRDPGQGGLSHMGSQRREQGRLDEL